MVEVSDIVREKGLDSPELSGHTPGPAAGDGPETPPCDTPVGGRAVSELASPRLPSGMTRPLSPARSSQSRRGRARKPHPPTFPAAPSLT